MARDEEKDVEQHPEAANADDRSTLPESKAYGEVHPDATAETYAAQTNRRGRMPGGVTGGDEDALERESKGKPVKGSALPSEEGHRS